MAIIVGLEEQKAALNRVKDNLAEICKINDNLLNLKEYIAQAKEKEYKMECKFVLPDDTLKRIKIPVILDDSAFLFNALKKHKEEVVKQIKDDASKYHISLSEQEEAALFSENK